jgi:hypothetical protein
MIRVGSVLYKRAYYFRRSMLACALPAVPLPRGLQRPCNPELAHPDWPEWTRHSNFCSRSWGEYSRWGVLDYMPARCLRLIRTSELWTVPR